MEKSHVLYSTAQYGTEEPDRPGPNRAYACKEFGLLERNALPPAALALAATTVESTTEYPDKLPSSSYVSVHDPERTNRGYEAAWVTT